VIAKARGIAKSRRNVDENKILMLLNKTRELLIKPK
jgi:hypothetical protein